MYIAFLCIDLKWSKASVICLLLVLLTRGFVPLTQIIILEFLEKLEDEVLRDFFYPSPANWASSSVFVYLFCTRIA